MGRQVSEVRKQDRRILAIDPGKMTGMSCWTWDGTNEPVLEWSAEVDEDSYAKPIRYELDHRPDLEIVCERFVITPETAKKTQAPYSLELIGVLKQELRDRGRSVEEINFQKPADAMKLFPNPALHALEYWHKGGAGHALDSIRHGLLRLLKTGWKPVRLLDED